MVQDRKTEDGRTAGDLAGLGIRPLTARSVVASLLLGSDGHRLPVGLLTGAAALFGVEPGATRTALSRMLDRGEVTAEAGWYTLAGRLAVRAGRQAESRHPGPDEWDGTWVTVAVGGDRRSAADRAAFRATMAAARFAEWREGVWVRPATASALAGLDDLDDLASCLVMRGRLERPNGSGSGAGGDERRLARTLWDLPAWADRAQRLRAAMRPEVRDLRRGMTEALPRAFLVAAAVARLLVTDPRLPARLLPARWPAPVLRAEYDEYERAFQIVLRDWYRREASRR